MKGGTVVFHTKKVTIKKQCKSVTFVTFQKKLLDLKKTNIHWHDRPQSRKHLAHRWLHMQNLDREVPR